MQMNLQEAVKLLTPCHPSRILKLALFRPYALSLAVATVKLQLKSFKEQAEIGRRIERNDFKSRIKVIQGGMSSLEQAQLEDMPDPIVTHRV